MRFKSLFPILILSLIFVVGCTNNSPEETNTKVSYHVLQTCNLKLTDAQVERHFTPPVASRNYAYPNIAAYLAIEPFYNEYQSLAGQLKDLEESPQPDLKKTYNLELVAFQAFMEVAFELVYRDTIISNFTEVALQEYKEKTDPTVYANSLEYAGSVAQHVLAWADKDMYKETRNFQEFAPSELPEKWKPTSPDYMPAIEPSWRVIRPFVLDSATQFRPIRPSEVVFEPGTKFYEETQQVLNAVNNATEEQREIANFWDCNPNISHHHGHFMFFLQKISPGGHWVHIALQALEAKDMNLDQAAATMAVLGISLHDAFIACWDEKYNSNYIRPETVIKNELDKEWDPILQTPAFPEYPSGHSVASAAAATVLTDLVDDQFEFIDSTEVPYGLPAREFKSFRQASDEAAISRLYGGIHFMPAIEEGVKMGNNVGDLVLERVKVKK
jgi:hypothetical protein